MSALMRAEHGATSIRRPRRRFSVSLIHSVLRSRALVSATGASLSTKPSGFTGGFQAGYNWQVSNNAVLGIEGDIGAFDLRGSSTASGFAQGVTFTTTSSASTTWLATVRGRLGLAANNWLFYVTGGAAFTTLKGNFAYSDNATNQEAASLSNAKAGYAVGGGVEAALWQQWSIKAEYLYVGFDRVATTGIVVGAGLGPQPINNSIDLKANIVRVGSELPVPVSKSGCGHGAASDLTRNTRIAARRNANPPPFPVADVSDAPPDTPVQAQGVAPTPPAAFCGHSHRSGGVPHSHCASRLAPF